MQQRSGTDRRRAAERNAAQPLGGQPRASDEDEELEEPERVPSLLHAREFDFGSNRRVADRRAPESGERHASASFMGGKGEPTIADDEPPRRHPPDENT